MPQSNSLKQIPKEIKEVIQSIWADDKIDYFHYYTIYIKFGLGRASYDAAQEIRNGKINREEGVQLVKV